MRTVWERSVDICTFSPEQSRSVDGERVPREILPLECRHA